MNKFNFGWIIGLLEGEGGFSSQVNKYKNSYPRIRINMVDKDVVERAAKVLDHSSIYIIPPRGISKQIQYGFQISGEKTRKYMKLFYPYLSDRRKNQINKALENYAISRPKRTK